MLFAELVGILKKVKTPEDVDVRVADELINAAIVSAMVMTERMVPEDRPELDRVELLEGARLAILRHFDQLMLDAYEEEE